MSADFFLGILAFTALLGVGAICWVTALGERVAEKVTDRQVKVAPIMIKVLSGVVGLAGGFATTDKSGWWLPALAGLVCVGLWDYVEKLADSWLKAAEKRSTAGLTALKTTCEEQMELLDIFRDTIDVRCAELTEAVRSRGEKLSLALLRKRLAPQSHLKQLLRDLLELFAYRTESTTASAPNFRVGLYVVRDSRLVPILAEDRNNPAYDVFKSYREHEAAFELDAAEKVSHAVRCIKRREMVLVEDCEHAAAAGEFTYFDQDQKGYLRSLVAHYMGEVVDVTGTPALAVIVVDSNLPGVFRSAQRDSLEFTLREFATRIRMEMVLLSLLGKKGDK